MTPIRKLKLHARQPSVAQEFSSALPAIALLISGLGLTLSIVHTSVYFSQFSADASWLFQYTDLIQSTIISIGFIVIVIMVIALLSYIQISLVIKILHRWRPKTVRLFVSFFSSLIVSSTFFSALTLYNKHTTSCTTEFNCGEFAFPSNILITAMIGIIGFGALYVGVRARKRPTAYECIVLFVLLALLSGILGYVRAAGVRAFGRNVTVTFKGNTDREKPTDIEGLAVIVITDRFSAFLAQEDTLIVPTNRIMAIRKHPFP